MGTSLQLKLNSTGDPSLSCFSRTRATAPVKTEGRYLSSRPEEAGTESAAVLDDVKIEGWRMYHSP